MENVKIDFLRNIQLFSSLTDEELFHVSSKVNLKEFKKNEVILYEQDTNEIMYIILFGQVKVIQTTQEGKEIILSTHKSNESFGEVSLIDGKTSPATVLATEDSLIAIIEKNDLYFLVLNHRKVLETLLGIFCSRLRESWQKIHMLNFKNASQRIKMLFLMLSHDNGTRTSKGLILNMKLTHQSIADMTGLTRETVTRIIDKWQGNGHIEILKNKSILLSNDFLEKVLNV